MLCKPMTMMLQMRRKKLLSSLLCFSASATQNPYFFEEKIHISSMSSKLLSSLQCFSASATQNPSHPPKPHFIVDYLVNSFGFSVEKATKTSKPLIGRLKSADKPDSVVSFLKLHGFDDTQIKSMISECPVLLYCNVDKSLGPNMKALIDMGFSGLALRKFVVSSPNALIRRSMVSRIGFWRTLLSNNDKNLQTAFTRNRGLICHVTTSIAPKITMLKNYGLSDQQIKRIILLGSFITRSMASMEALLKRTLEFGFQCSSLMFVHGLFALRSNSRAAFEAKMELLRTYGWSELEFVSAFQKSPMITSLSQRDIRAKMEFFVERAGCTPCYIALHPFLITYSLEKRLVPRHHVLQILEAKAVLRKMPKLTSLMAYSEKYFVDRFILRYKEELPGLHASYIVACAGNVPIELVSKVI